MSGSRRKFAIFLLASLTLLSSCKKKKPSVPQPQSQAPTITQPEPQPEPQVQPQPQPPVEATPPETPATATIPKPKPHRRHKKPVAPPPLPTEKSKTTVKEGGEKSPVDQLSAGIPEDEATRQRESAAQLRQATEKNLQLVTWQLSADQQAMVQQIRAYIAQSRSADNDGDIERSYNLAVKANLLSGELVKR